MVVAGTPALALAAGRPARAVHGIDRRSLRTAPDRRQVLRELADRLDGTVFTAHNAAFDWSFIERAARRDRVTLPEVRRLCTLRLSRRLDPDRAVVAPPRRPLRALRRRRTPGRTMRSYDARATAEVLQHLLAANQVAVAGDLDPLYERR